MPIRNLPSVHEFIYVIESKKSSYENDLDNLIKSLINLEFEISELPNLFDEKEYEDAPAKKEEFVNTVISNKYNFGIYHMPESINVKRGNKIVIFDSNYDIVSIYSALKEVQFYMKNTSYENSVWHLKNSYHSYWGFHLNTLKMFLHTLKY